MDRNSEVNDHERSIGPEPPHRVPDPVATFPFLPPTTGVAQKADLGRLRKTRGEASLDWTIPNFVTMDEKAGICCWSPTFALLDSSWQLQIFPNGETAMKSIGWIGLCLWKCDSGPPKMVSFTLGVRNSDGVEEMCHREEGHRFTGEGDWYSQFYFLDRSELVKRRTQVAPTGALTVTCTMRSKEQLPIEASLFKRLWNLGNCWRRVLEEEGSSNVELRLNDCDTPANSLVLRSRSAFFERLLAANQRRNKTQVVDLMEDDENAIEIVLSYMYSGEPKGLDGENASTVYRTAHKYDLQELKELCSVLIEKNMNMDSICDVIDLADLYNAVELKASAKGYFANNMTEVVKTEKWQVLKIKNPATVSDLLECALLEKVSEEEGEDLAHQNKKRRFQ